MASFMRRRVALCVLSAWLLLPASPLSWATLSPPEWVGIYDVQGRAGLLWIKSPQFKRYRIFRRRRDEGSWNVIAQTESNRYNDETIVPGVTYFYRLVGIVSAERESAPSEEISFMLKLRIKEPLGVPRIEGHLLLEKGIGLKWTHMDPALVVAYNVYRTLLPDGKEDLVGSTRENTFSDYRVEPGRSYRYRITALDINFKETEYSEPLTVIPELKAAPAAVEKAPVHVWTPRHSTLVGLLSGGGGKVAPLNCPTDVALSPDGLIFVADSGNALVQVFTPEGVFSHAFPVPPAPDSTRATPLGIAVDGDGLVYCTDAYSGRVLVFQPRGSLVRVLKIPRREPETTQTFGLLDLWVTASGMVYVVDNLNQRLAVFDRAGRFLRFFGLPGLAPGEFTYPGFCLVDPQGRVLVSESLGARIQFFDAEGKFLKAFGRYAKNVGCFARPKGVALDSAGRIFVADSWLCQIQAFDEDGRFLFLLTDEQGKPLDLGSPNGIAIDRENNIYIAERLAHRVQIRHIAHD